MEEDGKDREGDEWGIGINKVILGNFCLLVFPQKQFTLMLRALNEVNLFSSSIR
jgi:hypothetical protein